MEEVVGHSCVFADAVIFGTIDEIPLGRGDYVFLNGGLPPPSMYRENLPRTITPVGME